MRFTIASAGSLLRGSMAELPSSSPTTVVSRALVVAVATVGSTLFTGYLPVDGHISPP